MTVLVGDLEAKSGVIERIKPDPAYFVRLRRRGKPVLESKLLAGYSKNTDTAVILNTSGAIAATLSLEEARIALQTKQGHTIIDNAEAIREVRDHKDTPPHVVVSAAKAHVEITGQAAPIRTESKSTSYNMIDAIITIDTNGVKAIESGEIQL